MTTHKELVRQLGASIAQPLLDKMASILGEEKIDYYSLAEEELQSIDQLIIFVVQDKISFGAKMFEEGYEQCCKDNGLHYSPDDPDVFGAMTKSGLIAEKEGEDE